MNTKLYIFLRERRAVSVRVYLRFYNAGIRQSHLKNTKIFLLTLFKIPRFSEIMQFIMSNVAKKNVLRACMFRIGWSTHAQFIPKICWHLCVAHKPKIFRRRERVRFSAVIAFGKTKSCLISMKIRML